MRPVRGERTTPWRLTTEEPPGYASQDQSGQLPDRRGHHGQVLQASQQTRAHARTGTGQQAALLSNPGHGPAIGWAWRAGTPAGREVPAMLCVLTP